MEKIKKIKLNNFISIFVISLILFFIINYLFLTKLRTQGNEINDKTTYYMNLSVAPQQTKDTEDISFIEKISLKNNEEINQEKLFAYSLSDKPGSIINIYDPRNLRKHSYITRSSYLMEYIGTNFRDSNFYNVRLQGEIFSIHKDDLALVKNSQILSFPHYYNENGYIVHMVENNPFKENSWYLKTVLGKAPQWMLPGKGYYSFNGIYFTDNRNQLGNPDIRENMINANNPYYDEYLYKPLRSKTIYSSSELDTAFNVLANRANIGYTVMSNTGKDFIHIQQKYGTNALILLSMGIHESRFGSSSFAVNRNNLFGIRAYDSDPNNAFYFNSVQECIYQHGNNLSWTYADADYVNNMVYYGSHLGNKSSGMNVKYASDPFWGEKIANYCAQIDRLLGERDYCREKTIMLPQGTKTYWNNLKTEYAHTYQPSTSTLGNMYSAILKDNNEKILLEPPYNSNRLVSPNEKEGGIFNNYEGYLDSQNYYYVGCDNSHKVINENNLKFYVNNFEEKKIIKAEEYVDGKLARIYEYYPNTTYGNDHHKHIQLIFHLDINSSISIAKQYTDNILPVEDNAVCLYEYYPNTYYSQQHEKRIKEVFVFNDKESIKHSKKILEGSECNDSNVTRIFEYYENTKYGVHDDKIKFEFFLNDDKTLQKAFMYQNKTILHVYEYYPNARYGLSHEKNIMCLFILENNSISKSYQYKNNMDAIPKNIVAVYEYYPNTIYGHDHHKHIQLIFNITEGGKIKHCKHYNNNEVEHLDNAKIVYGYYPNTIYGLKHEMHIKYIHFLMPNEKLFITKEYNDNESHYANNSIKIYEYYPNTYYTDNFLNFIKLEFFLKDKEKIDYAKELSKEHKLENIYEYHNDTIYGDEHYKRYKLIHRIDKRTNYILYTRKFNECCQQPYQSFMYIPGTIFDSNRSYNYRIVHRFFHNEEGQLKNSIEYVLANNDQIKNIYEYFDNTYINENYENSIKLKFYLDEKKFIEKAYEFNTQKHLINIYEYYPNTKYECEHHRRIRYIFNLYNAEKVINFAFERDINKDINKYKYYFKENTIYGCDHWNRVTKKEELN